MRKTNMEYIPANILEARKNAGMNIPDFCEQLGISTQGYYRYLKAGGIPWYIYYRNPEFFGASLPEDFYDFTSDSLAANMRYYRVTIKELSVRWAGQFTLKKICSMLRDGKNLYPFREILKDTFKPYLVLRVKDDSNGYEPLRPKEKQKSSSERAS